MPTQHANGRGRVFQPPGRKVWMLAYYGPKGNGTRGEIRESAKTRDEAIAWKRLQRKMRDVANDQDGIADFEGPAQKRTTVGGLFDDLLQFYEQQEIKSSTMRGTGFGKAARCGTSSVGCAPAT